MTAPPPGVVFEVQDPRIRESSGLAVASYDPALVFTHNDSSDGEPAQLFAVTVGGRTRATYPLARLTCEDCEDLARDNARLWLADIGNNWHRRREVALYEVAEPRGPSHPLTRWTRYRVRYGDGRHDAEGLVVQPGTGRVFLVTKELVGTSAVYTGPARLDPDGVNVFTRAAPVPLVATGAAFSPTGDRLVIRGYRDALLWRVSRGDVLRALRTVPERLPLPRQRQGEAVAFTADGRALLLSSEGLSQPLWRVPLASDAPSRNAEPAAPPYPHGVRQRPPARPWWLATLTVAFLGAAILRSASARSRPYGRRTVVGTEA